MGFRIQGRFNLSTVQEDQLTSSSPSASRPESRRNRLYILLIIAVWLVLYVPGMFSPALLDDADSVHAEAAREMVVRGDWTTLYINGLRYLEKAPLMYWGMCLTFSAWGVTEWTARLPLTISILFALLAVYQFGRRFFTEAAGLYAALALGLSFGPYIFTRILIPDIVVGLFLTIGFYCFLAGLEHVENARRNGAPDADQNVPIKYAWGLALSAALNVLTKGLIGVVFPFGIIFAYLFVTRNLRHFLRMRLVSSFLVFLVVAAPWHIAATLKNPPAGEAKGFAWFYFVNEHFLRYLNKRVPKDYDTVPFSIFWGTLLIWLGPWTAFMFKAFAKVPVKWQSLTSLDRRGRATLLCAIWALTVYGFFSFSSRQEYYIVPAFAAIALVIGAWMSDEQVSPRESKERRAGVRASWVLLSIGVPAGLTALFMLLQSKNIPAGTELYEVLTKNPDQYALSFGHFLDLTGTAMGFFRVPLLMTAIALGGGTIANLFFRKRGQVWKANAALAIMMLIFLHAAHMGLVTFSPVLSSKTLSEAIGREYKEGDIVAVIGPYEEASTLNFYGHYLLHPVNSRDNGNTYYGSRFPDAPKVFLNDQSLAQLWASEKKVFLWTPEDEIPASVRESGFAVVAKSGGKYILKNR